MYARGMSLVYGAAHSDVIIQSVVMMISCTNVIQLGKSSKRQSRESVSSRSRLITFGTLYLSGTRNGAKIKKGGGSNMYVHVCSCMRIDVLYFRGRLAQRHGIRAGRGKWG